MSGIIASFGDDSSNLKMHCSGFLSPVRVLQPREGAAATPGYVADLLTSPNPTEMQRDDGLAKITRLSACTANSAAGVRHNKCSPCASFNN